MAVKKAQYGRGLSWRFYRVSYEKTHGSIYYVPGCGTVYMIKDVEYSTSLTVHTRARHACSKQPAGKEADKLTPPSFS